MGNELVMSLFKGPAASSSAKPQAAEVVQAGSYAMPPQVQRQLAQQIPDGHVITLDPASGGADVHPRGRMVDIQTTLPADLRIPIPTIFGDPGLRCRKASFGTFIDMPYHMFAQAWANQLNRDVDDQTGTDLTSGELSISPPTPFVINTAPGFKHEVFALLATIDRNQLINATDVEFQMFYRPTGWGINRGLKSGPLWRVTYGGMQKFDVLFFLARRVFAGDAVIPESARVENQFDGGYVVTGIEALMNTGPNLGQAEVRIARPNDAVVIDFFAFLQGLVTQDPAAVQRLKNSYPAAIVQNWTRFWTGQL
jgi:hypothetical protein